MDALSLTAQDDSSGANPSSIKSDDSSPQHEGGSGSPPPNCAICLGKCKNKSFTDSCLHQFCFSCLLTWSKVKAECPLCKQNFRSIIHNVRSNHQYEEYMVVQRHNEDASRIDIDRLTASHRFRYRTTLTLPRRESMAIQQLLRHYPLVADVFPPGRAPLACRRRSPAAFRRTVYRHNLWARPLPDFTGRFRDCTPAFYSYNNTQMHRLVPWLNRELHYLLNENVGHISYVIARILELLPRIHITSTEFREATHRYFGDRTDHFLHELYCFASTPYDMAGYDRHVQYTTDTRISTMVNEVISSSDTDATIDSDIVMISSSGPTDPPPGPSRIPAPVYPQNHISQPATGENVIPIETISHSDTDDDSEVMVVGYIKPPEQRTPEVVDLLESDSDVIVQDAVERPSNPVKVTLKRHRARGAAQACDSDSSADVARTPKRRRRARSRVSTTSDTSRTTPERADRSWAPPRLSTSTCSDFSSDVEPAPRIKTRKRASAAARDRRRTEKRSSRSTEPPSEVDARNARKSHSGKGVKSSSRNTAERSTPSDCTPSTEQPPSSASPPRTPERALAELFSPDRLLGAPCEPSTSRPAATDSDRIASMERSKSSVSPIRTPERALAEMFSQELSSSTLCQPSTSGTGGNHNRKPHKERNRKRRDSRESRRLRSVVNVIHSSHRNTDESNSSANYSNFTNVAATSNRSDGETLPNVIDTFWYKAESSYSALGLLGVLSSPNGRQVMNTSDSDDDLPLNLTLQKKKPPPLT